MRDAIFLPLFVVMCIGVIAAAGLTLQGTFL